MVGGEGIERRLCLEIETLYTTKEKETERRDSKDEGRLNERRDCGSVRYEWLGSEGAP